MGTKYKTHLFSMFSQLFCTITEVIISRFGNEGKQAMIEAVEKYGEERGRRIAELVKSLGKETDLKNFFIYGDFDSRANLTYSPNLVEGDLEICITECPFHKGCKAWEKEEYGKIYCEYIDKAILRGYNPKLVLKVPSGMTKGDEKCLLRYIAKEQK
ncbi:MAG: L-2-amino-thiazoline-4-carboxylic acid hydrolase [Candidatus Lokiarchaeia archaeon]